MLHKLNKKIRHYWHDLYYYFASKKGVDFAMTCQDATAKIDLSDQAKTTTDKARVKLHLSLCQACNNYHTFSQVLRRALRKITATQKSKRSDLEKLNHDLLKKYSKN